jgi:hypothetical protein
MSRVEGIGARTKDLGKQRDRLVEELEKLKEKHKNGEINENSYEEKRHEIERALVEVMDRLAQMRFLSGQA